MESDNSVLFSLNAPEQLFDTGGDFGPAIDNRIVRPILRQMKEPP